MRIHIVVALLLATGPVVAHDAPPSKKEPLGWTYDKACCSINDCRQLSDGSVLETPKGYTIASTQELIPYNDRRIHRSKDEFYHQCENRYVTGESLCLYVPDRGY